MTQAPIETHHKDMAAKAAGESVASLRFCTTVANASVLAHAQTLANDEAKGKALARINAVFPVMMPANLPNEVYSAIAEIAAIAAPYRASDPVAEALVEALEIAFDQWQPHGTLRNSWAKSVAAELGRELPKRGLEIVERRDR